VHNEGSLDLVYTILTCTNVAFSKRRTSAKPFFFFGGLPGFARSGFASFDFRLFLPFFDWNNWNCVIEFDSFLEVLPKWSVVELGENEEVDFYHFFGACLGGRW